MKGKRRKRWFLERLGERKRLEAELEAAEIKMLSFSLGGWMDRDQD